MPWHFMLHLTLFGCFLFPNKPSSDTVKWRPCVTIDLAAHLEEWQLNQDKLLSAHRGISLQPNPLVQWASDNAVVHIDCFTMKPLNTFMFSSLKSMYLNFMQVGVMFQHESELLLSAICHVLRSSVTQVYNIQTYIQVTPLKKRAITYRFQ